MVSRIDTENIFTRDAPVESVQIDRGRATLFPFFSQLSLFMRSAKLFIAEHSIVDEAAACPDVAAARVNREGEVRFDNYCGFGRMNN